MGFFDKLLGKKKQREEAELLEALQAVAQQHASAIQRGCDTDEIPEGHGEFGHESTNPVPVKGIPSSEIYLGRLRWEGAPVTWRRLGSFGAENIEMPIDGYEILDANSARVAMIYISPYHKTISRKAPKGFTIVD